MAKEDSSSKMVLRDKFVEMVTLVGKPNFRLLSPTPVSDSNCCNIQSVSVLPLSTVDHSVVDRQKEGMSKEYLRKRKLEEIKKGKSIALDPEDQGRRVNVKRRKFIEVAPQKSKLKEWLDPKLSVEQFCHRSSEGDSQDSQASISEPEDEQLIQARRVKLRSKSINDSSRIPVPPTPVPSASAPVPLTEHTVVPAPPVQGPPPRHLEVWNTIKFHKFEIFTKLWGPYIPTWVWEFYSAYGDLVPKGKTKASAFKREDFVVVRGKKVKCRSDDINAFLGALMISCMIILTRTEEDFGGSQEVGGTPHIRCHPEVDRGWCTDREEGSECYCQILVRVHQ
uniref:Putative plant transposon protein domain-containing protein n=1 Tax=Solanum tuberosum TaxID=4113 RepID=M1DZD5_SOLTU